MTSEQREWPEHGERTLERGKQARRLAGGCGGVKRLDSCQEGERGPTQASHPHARGITWTAGLTLGNPFPSLGPICKKEQDGQLSVRPSASVTLPL